MARVVVARVVVVGAGVMGSAAAWRLARRGAAVTLLDRYGPDHRWGASHGSARIFRLTYPADDYVRLGHAGLPLWAELDRHSDGPLLAMTGAVDHGPADVVGSLHSGLVRAGVTAELLDPGEAARRWPGLRFDAAVMLHRDAGRIHADRSVRALRRAAVALGAVLRHGVTVTAVRASGPGVRVYTSDGEVITADAAVVAAGAWTTGLLDGFGLPPLRVTLEQPTHFRPRAGSLDWPSFLHHPGAGLPAAEYPVLAYGLATPDGIKIGLHGVGAVIDPDPERQERRPDPALARRLADYVRRWVPGADPDSGVPDGCLYTCTPDHDFVVDRSGPVTVLAGFSGHGFKFAPAIGELAARLALDGEASPARFRLDRLARDSAGSS
jgi:sarcosine oxidase